MTLQKLQFAWKYRRPLWKYRRVLKHRRKLAWAAAMAVAVAGVMLVRGSSRTASNQ